MEGLQRLAAIQDLPRIAQAQEQALVEAFVAQANVEAQSVCILQRPARNIDVQIDCLPARPLLQYPADQFGTIVQRELRGMQPQAAHALQDTHHAAVRQAGIHLEGEGLAGGNVDDTEQPDHAPRGHHIVEEVHRPLCVPLQWGERGAGSDFRLERVMHLVGLRDGKATSPPQPLPDGRQ